MILLRVSSTQKDLSNMLKTFLSLFKGEDERVHKTKRQYNTTMLNIHLKAKEQVKTSKDLVIMIENSTAYKIAKATGRMKK